MSPAQHLRTSLVYALSFSLLLTGLVSITTRQSQASNNPPPSSLIPNINEPAEKATSQAKPVDEATRSRVQETLGKLPLSFEENQGQVDNEVKYISRGTGYTLFLTQTEAVLALRKADFGLRNGKQVRDLSHPQSEIRNPQSSVLRMKLKGANRTPTITGESEMGARTNYFIGNDPQRWQTGVQRYERVRYTEVYPGIDVIYYGQQQSLEYDFVVAPFADARPIALEFDGVKRVRVERGTGDLVLKVAGGEVRQHKPVAYQEVGSERREVASRYVLHGRKQVAIEVGEYDRTKPLIIDPVLSYSTYLGGSELEIGWGIAADSSGHAYVTGVTHSSDFPTSHQYQVGQGGINAFVTKFDTNASGAASLLYSTYLGGEGEDGGISITVDSSGITYVTGYTLSSDFPTLHQYQTDQGGNDAFVAKLDTNLSGAASLLYSTYLGGNNHDGGFGIAVDSAGYTYVTGSTGSNDFPTLHQYQTDRGGVDVFVTKLDTGASGAASLLYSTYLGGSLEDVSWGIAADSSGNAYVTGYTYSTAFPTKNEYRSDLIGEEAFVSVLDTNLAGEASLLYSTYLGGSSEDVGTSIIVDSSGVAYVTGWTSSDDFPTLNQYQTYQEGYYDAFVTKLNPNLSGEASLLYSTYLGGGDYDFGFGIGLDSAGNAYVAGYTYSTDFPTFNQYQAVNRGGDEAFVTKLDTNAPGEASLLYSTYLGGTSYDECFGLAVDPEGYAYVVGYTYSTDFPTRHQYQVSHDYVNAFVTKLDPHTDSISGRITNDGMTGISGVTITLGGSVSRTVATNSTGHYSFVNLPLGGNYTVTPSKSGLTFVPSAKSFNNLQASQTNVNFITRPAAISGKITKETVDGVGVGGVTLTLTGDAGFTPRTTTTAANGTYSFSNLPTPGNYYRLTPSKSGYGFRPAQLVFHHVTTDQTGQNFIATPKTFTISGTVKLGAVGLEGVTVKLTSPSPAGFAPQTVTTNSSGAYSFDVPGDRDYTLMPVKSGYQITPAGQTVTNLSANRTGVNFTVTVYSIRGRIRRASINTGISEVTVALTSLSPAGFPARTVRTDSGGYYTFTNLPAGRNYTIKPVKSGLTFTPAKRSITNLSSNIPAGVSTNFTGAGP